MSTRGAGLLAPPPAIARVDEPRLKRPLDVVLALLGLLASSPLWAVIALAIRLESGRPIFYFQERAGRRGRTFLAWKFRSMVKDAEAASGPVAATDEDPRITRVGRLLRSTAMDELPQFVNILKGDMSFVGPRADRPWEVEQRDGELHRGDASGADASAPTFEALIPNYHLRLLVRPGLTGLAQIYGRYDTPRRQKLRFDLLYVRRQTFWLDVRLILLSLWISVRGKWESRSAKL